jgi:hypothetical protein
MVMSIYKTLSFTDGHLHKKGILKMSLKLKTPMEITSKLKDTKSFDELLYQSPQSQSEKREAQKILNDALNNNRAFILIDLTR